MGQKAGREKCFGNPVNESDAKEDGAGTFRAYATD